METTDSKTPIVTADTADAFNGLGVDEISSILSFLTWKEILQARVSTLWREAARSTIVPPSPIADDGWSSVLDFYVRNREYAIALGWLSRALPGMHAIHIDFSMRPTEEFRIADGQGARERLVFAANDEDDEPIDLTVLSNFHGLQSLNLQQTHLNGSYPFLFQFHHLKSLDVVWNPGLVWDLEMLSGLPSLERLRAPQNHALTGNIRSVRVLRQTLVSFNIYGCNQVEGNLMDMADFPKLEELKVGDTNVTGDIREITATDFVSIKELELSDGVYGGGNLQRVDDAPAIMYAKYVLKKRNPALFTHRRWRLDDDSPDWYAPREGTHHSRAPPFCIEFVQAGPRLGWRWTNAVTGGSCEAQWIDPEPVSGDEGYDDYQQESQRVGQDVDFYRGFSRRPPTRTEHQRLCVEIPLDPMLQWYQEQQQQQQQDMFWW